MVTHDIAWSNVLCLKIVTPNNISETKNKLKIVIPFFLYFNDIVYKNYGNVR